MIVEITCGADPTMVVRKKVDDTFVPPVSSAGLNIHFIPEDGDPPELLEKKSRKDRKKKAQADPLEVLDKE